MEAFKKLVESNLEMVHNGEISVQDFVRRTRPIVERHEFESNNIIKENIKMIKEMKKPSAKEPGIFDAETIIKRRQRMNKIERAYKMIDLKAENPGLSADGSTTEIFNNDKIRIVSK